MRYALKNDLVPSPDVSISKPFAATIAVSSIGDSKDIEINRPKKCVLASHSGYRLALWLLAAYFLVGSAITTTAQVVILARNQDGGNIIVDGSRVYWINRGNSVVSSVDKLHGGVIRIHNHAGTAVSVNGDIVQDNLNLYFASQQTPPGRPFSNFNLYRVPKTSSTVTQLTRDLTGHTNSWDNTLAISNGWLYYFSGFQEVTWDGFTNYRTIEKISTQGGTPRQVIPLTHTAPNISTVYFSVDGVSLDWTDTTNLSVLRVPLVGGSFSIDNHTVGSPRALSTPTTGPAGGYTFWVEATAASKVLKGKRPGGTPLILVNGVVDANLRCFVQVGSFVYCTRASDFTIVRVPINGGAPTVVVNTVGAFLPRGLTSDGTYIYWTAGADHSIRRVPLPP